MNAIELLEDQHREVEQLFARLREAPVGERDELFEMLAEALTLHAALEEEHFYPALTGFVREERLELALEEHTHIRRLLADLLGQESDGPGFFSTLDELEKLHTAHVEGEERTLFATARRIMGPDGLNVLGSELTRRIEPYEDWDFHALSPL